MDQLGELLKELIASKSAYLLVEFVEGAKKLAESILVDLFQVRVEKDRQVFWSPLVRSTYLIDADEVLEKNLERAFAEFLLNKSRKSRSSLLILFSI